MVEFGRKKLAAAGKAQQVTGVIGLDRGVGTTHFCVLMANYYCSACGRKTAALEWNDHGDFVRFGSVCTGLGKNESKYRIQGVDFYPKADNNRLVGCLFEEYQEIVIDFGVWREQACIDLMRCQKVILIVSFSEWQTGVFEGNGNWTEFAIKNGWHCLTAMGSEESRKKWNMRRKPTIDRIPFSVDAFTVTKDWMDWMKHCL